MVALMKYANGLRFTGLVFENKEIAEKWLKAEHKNPKPLRLSLWLIILLMAKYYKIRGKRETKNESL